MLHPYNKQYNNAVIGAKFEYLRFTWLYNESLHEFLLTLPGMCLPLFAPTLDASPRIDLKILTIFGQISCSS